MRPHITHAYIALRPCGCCVDTVLDDPTHPDSVTQQVNALRERGLEVKRVTCKEAGERITVWCFHKRVKTTMKYQVITADPPWDFTTYSDKAQKSAKQHYPVMNTAAIMKMPVASVAADDSILLLWATWPNLVDGIRVGEAWGFTYKTLGFIWVKRSVQGSGWHTGLGYYTRANSEPCLLFTKGHPKRRDNGVSQLIIDDDSVNCLPGFEEVLTARLTAHSAKPDEFYNRVETLLAPSYLELFGRRKRKGWKVLGNEIDGLDINEALIQEAV